jgi:hypothetical protein
MGMWCPNWPQPAAPIIHKAAGRHRRRHLVVPQSRRIATKESRLPAALDRIARTPAKTDRGKAIKLKHAGSDEQQKAELRARAGRSRPNTAPLCPKAMPGWSRPSGGLERSRSARKRSTTISRWARPSRNRSSLGSSTRCCIASVTLSRDQPGRARRRRGQATSPARSRR